VGAKTPDLKNDELLDGIRRTTMESAGDHRRRRWLRVKRKTKSEKRKTKNEKRKTKNQEPRTKNQEPPRLGVG
jgi:hypothetical protein